MAEGFIEYWLQGTKFARQIQNHFSLESKTDLEIFQKISAHIGVIYKPVLESVKTLNPIFEVTEYWYKAEKCQIWSTNTKPYFWENLTLKFSKKKFCPPYWSFLKSYSEVFQKCNLLNQCFESSESMYIDTRLEISNFFQ